MEYIAWAFSVLNGIVSLYSMYRWSTLYNNNGVWGLAAPAAWVWIWQLLGVAIVPLAGMSPWHLIWWFPVGWVICIVIGKALYYIGVIRL